MEKIMQITNVNKIFTAFPTMIKHIDNRAKIYKNSDEFFRSLVKRLKIKFLHPMKRSLRIDLFIGMFYKKVALNNFEKKLQA